MTNDELRIFIKHYDSASSSDIWCDVSEYVIETGFPKAFEEQLKGSGYFDYQVKSFTFTAIFPMLYYASGEYVADKPSRYDKCKFYDNTGAVIFSGFVDELQDSDEEWTIEITVMPSAVILKDFDVGAVETQDDEISRVFETETLMHVRDISQQVLTYVNSQTENKAGIQFSLDSDSIPNNNFAPNSLPFVGTILEKTARKGDSWFLRRFVFGEIDQGGWEGGGSNSKFHIRKNPSSGTYYLINTQARWGLKTLINEGEWLSIPYGSWFLIPRGEWINFSFTWGWYLGWPFSFTIGFDFGQFVVPPADIAIPSSSISIPSSDIKIPSPEARHTVYEMAGGNLTHVATHSYFPLFPFNETPTFSLQALYGTIQTNSSSSNISTSKVINFVTKKKYDSAEIQALIDIDSSNTFAFVHARKVKHRWLFDDYEVGTLLIVLFETAFDEYYRVKYLNKTPMSIFKDLCKVSNRYFYVDTNDKIFMLPRGDALTEPTALGITTQDYFNILSKKVKSHREVEVDIDINRWEDDDDGFVSYGIKLRDAELEAIKKFYHDLFSRERREYKIKFLQPTSDVGLMKQLVVSDGDSDLDYGHIIETSASFLEPITEVKSEKYV